VEVTVAVLANTGTSDISAMRNAALVLAVSSLRAINTQSQQTFTPSSTGETP
jgi:hypothetical protein